MKARFIFIVMILSVLLTGCHISTDKGLSIDTPKVAAEDIGHEINAGLSEVLSDELAKSIVEELNDMLDEDSTSPTIRESMETEEWY